jgi:hypothetical protein
VIITKDEKHNLISDMMHLQDMLEWFEKDLPRVLNSHGTAKSRGCIPYIYSFYGGGIRFRLDRVVEAILDAAVEGEEATKEEAGWPRRRAMIEKSEEEYGKTHNCGKSDDKSPVSKWWY